MPRRKTIEIEKILKTIDEQIKQHEESRTRIYNKIDDLRYTSIKNFNEFESIENQIKYFKEKIKTEYDYAKSLKNAKLVIENYSKYQVITNHFWID